MVCRFLRLFTFSLLSFCLYAHVTTAAPVVVAEERSQYHTIYVTDEPDGLRCIRFSLVLPGLQSCVDPKDPQRLALSYAHAMLGALYIQPKPERILMIGLGGGSLPTALRQIYPNAEIDSVEIDPAVVKVAERFFYFKPDAQSRVHIGDGRHFVRQAIERKAQYDLILVDAFDKNYIPEHMLSLQFLLEMKKILAPSGVVATNTASAGALYAYESATYAAAFGAFFNLKPEGRIILAPRDGIPSTVTLAANAEALEKSLAPLGVRKEKLLPLFISKPDWPEGTQILTDKYAPADLLNRQSATEAKP